MEKRTLERIPDEETLTKRLAEDLLSCDKERVVFMAGHFPIGYAQGRAYESVRQWGDFTTYSLGLAAQLGAYVRETGKGVRFAFIADDINFEEVGDNKGFGRHQKERWRDALYRLRSGEVAGLHPELAVILNSFGFDVADVVRQDYSERKGCLYLSERVLRAQRQDVKNECAKAYLAFLENSTYIDKERDYLVSFIPDRCSGAVCEVFDDKVKGVSASHVVMQTEPTCLSGATVNRIWNDWGVMYRRD